jgi:hypothetical protein
VWAGVKNQFGHRALHNGPGAGVAADLLDITDRLVQLFFAERMVHEGDAHAHDDAHDGNDDDDFDEGKSGDGRVTRDE